MSDLAYPVNLRVTASLIAVHPIDIDIVRPTMVSDGAGGWVKSSVSTIGTQTVRKVGIAGNPRELMSADGQLRIASAVVIALPDADIVAGDTFEADDHVWEVLSTNLDPPWRLRAEVYRRG